MLKLYICSCPNTQIHILGFAEIQKDSAEKTLVTYFEINFT